MVKPSSRDKAVRLADLADRARALGRIEQADRFLLLAWAAYDEGDLIAAAADRAPEQPSRRAS